MEHWQAVASDIWFILKWAIPFGSSLMILYGSSEDNPPIALAGIIFYALSLWSISQ